MIRMKIPGVKSYRSKGKTFHYHRATGIRLRALPGTPAFLQEFAAAEARRLGKVGETAGTFGQLCADYKASPHFQSLAPRTQADYRKILDYVEDLREMPLHEWTRGRVLQLRDQAQKEKKRRFANYLIAVLSAVFAWAEERQIVEQNPVARVKKIKRDKDAPDANRPWAEREWNAVISAAPKHVKPALLVMGLLGWRGGEVFGAQVNQWDQKANTLFRRASKSRKAVLTPIPGQLLKALHANYPKDSTVLFLNSRKKKWTGNGFRVVWQKLRGELIEKGKIGGGLTLHGLRHTCATRLSELGFDERTIADMLGQESTEMARHYSRKAKTEEKLRGVVKRIDFEGRKKVRQSAKKAK